MGKCESFNVDGEYIYSSGKKVFGAVISFNNENGVIVIDECVYFGINHLEVVSVLVKEARNVNKKLRFRGDIIVDLTKYIEEIPKM